METIGNQGSFISKFFSDIQTAVNFLNPQSVKQNLKICLKLQIPYCPHSLAVSRVKRELMGPNAGTSMFWNYSCNHELTSKYDQKLEDHKEDQLFKQGWLCRPAVDIDKSQGLIFLVI